MILYGVIMNIRNEIIIRKLNSILILLIILLLLWHGLLSALYMFNIISYSPNFITTGRRLFLFVSLHIIFSLYLYFKDSKKRNKFRTYFNIQNDTSKQLVTGIFILIFMFSHYISYSLLPISITNSFNISIIHFIIDNLLFISIYLHLQVSLPRLLISLGFLENENSYHKAKSRTRIILLVFLILFFVAEIIFYLI